MQPVNELFTQEARDSIFNFYRTFEPAQELIKYRSLPPQKVKTIIFGASISSAFRIGEFFPGCSFLNRGIPGDTLDGLYGRIDDDVFPYHPEQVLLMVGINGIQEDNAVMLRKYEALGDLLTERGIRAYLTSVTPLRHGDQWNRFQYQGKIVELNRQLHAMADRKFAGYVDFFSALIDENGELGAAYAREDGTHITFEGYCAMAEALKKVVELY